MTFGRTDGWLLADEWFADYLRRVGNRQGHGRVRVMRDGIPRAADRHLAREREYDAETERLRRTIRDNTRHRQERRHA